MSENRRSGGGSGKKAKKQITGGDRDVNYFHVVIRRRRAFRVSHFFPFPFFHLRQTAQTHIRPSGKKVTHKLRSVSRFPLSLLFVCE